MIFLAASFFASISHAEMDAVRGLGAARAVQFAQRTERVLPTRVCGVSTNGVSLPDGLLALDGKCTTLARDKGMSKPYVVVDLGEASLSGYAVLHVKGFRGSVPPVLRVSYACFPGTAEKYDTGDYGELWRAYYMGACINLPVLPTNINRHELYTICRNGTFIAPMHQGQFRYARIALESEDSEVELDGIEWIVGNWYDRQSLAGYFYSSDAELNLHWQIGVWTSQLATIRDVAAWRAIDGWLLPRKLEKGPDVGLCKEPQMTLSGSVATTFELRKCPDRIMRVGLALFGKDADNVLLVSLDEKGIFRWVRRENGLDHVLKERSVAGLSLVDCRPYHLEFRYRPGTEKLYSAKVHYFEVYLDGQLVDTIQYFQGIPGYKFGLWTPKGEWPMLDFVEVKNEDGKVVFQDDFNDASLSKWDFLRPNPIVADGAKRDRLIWSGDLWWAGRNLYYSLRDQYGMRESIKLLARVQTPEGYIHACPYPEQTAPQGEDYGMFQSDEFAAWFVPVLYDYWLYTADRETLRLVWPSLVKLMNYLDAHTGADGLYEQRHETSKHASASHLQAGDVAHRSFMNILLYECRKDAAEMARAMGDAMLSDRWATAAKKTKTAIFKVFWQPNLGCFSAQKESGSVEWDTMLGKMVNKPNNPSALEANAFALASHMVTDDQAKTIAAVVHAGACPIKFVVMGARAKAEYDMPDEAWAMLATNSWKVYVGDNWKGPMTTTEGMHLWDIGSIDQSHPDTALAGLISTVFLGIVPVEPGFRVFKFEPHPYKGLRFAEGRVPTPYGAIDARWERTPDGGMGYELNVPCGTRCLLNGKSYGPGRHFIKDPKKEILK